MKHRFYTADVFTDRPFAGNQLAVFPNATALTDRTMQQIAREFNFSETVFVLPPNDPDHTRRLRIFTPGTEVPFAGHPTIGAAHVLAATGGLAITGPRTDVVFEEGVGPVPVSIDAGGGQPWRVYLTAPVAPVLGPEPPACEAIAQALTLEPGDLRDDEMQPQAVSCGLPFLFVPLRDRGAVARARINRDAWESVLRPYWAPHVFFFAFDPERPGSDIRARMFAPVAGVDEDPATGSAATALAAYLAARDEISDGTLTWVIEQGFEMGRPSIILAEARKRGGDISSIRVGGSSVLVTEGAMEVPEEA